MNFHLVLSEKQIWEKGGIQGNKLKKITAAFLPASG